MKVFLLLVAILSPIQSALSAPLDINDPSQRPLAAAIRSALDKNAIDSEQIKFLLDQGVRTFTLNDFMSADAKVSATEYQINHRPVIQNGQGAKTALIEIKDPKTKEIVSVEVPIGHNPNGSPAEVYKKYVEHVTKKPNMREMIHNLPMESLVFYYGLGLSNLVSLITHAEDDPKVFDRYLKSFTDPVSQISFFAFILGNRTGSWAMNSLLFSTLFSKRLSPNAKLFISKILIPNLGMAVGGIVSNSVHDLVTLMKGCSNAMLGIGGEKTKEQIQSECNAAYKQVFSQDNAYQYLTAATAMVTTGLLLAGAQGTIVKMGKAVSSKAVIRNIALRIGTAANWIPAPQARFAISFLKSTYGAVHLMAFLKLDHMLINPIVHGIYNKHFNTGPDFLKTQQEMLRRLDVVTVNQYQEKHSTPLTEKDEEQLLKEIIAGAKNISLKSRFESPVKSQVNTANYYRAVNEIRLENVKNNTTNKKDLANLNFSDLLQKHYEFSDKWRQSLFAPMQTQFQSWLDVIAPLNASVQMTYDFYYDFFKEAATMQGFNKNLPELNSRHLLLHDDILGNLKMTDLKGEEIKEKTYNLQQQDIFRLNTIAQSVCMIDLILKNNDRLLKTSKRLPYQFIKEDLGKVRAAFNIAPQQLVCSGVNMSLKTQPDYKNVDLAQIHKGLTTLNFLIQRYAKEVDLFNIQTVANPEADIQKQLYVSLNLLEGLQYALGNPVAYERGERFIEGWDYTFKETQPDFYKKIHPYSAATKLLNAMACSTKPTNALISESKLFGNVSFQMPSVVSQVNNDLCVRALGRLSTESFTTYNQRNNPALGQLIDYTIANTKPEIFGPIPVEVKNAATKLASLTSNTRIGPFMALIANQANSNDLNRFTNWWDSTVEPQITQKFKEFTTSYAKGLHKNLAKNINSYDGNLDRNIIPESITLSYLGQMSIYIDYILAIYAEKVKDPTQIELAQKLKAEILENLKKQLEEYVKISTDKDDLSNTYAKTLALIKKLKSLILAPNMNTSSLLNDPNNPDATKFRNAMSYYCKQLYGSLPEEMHKDYSKFEFMNALEIRVQEDDYTNEAFRKAISEVGKVYENLLPTYFPATVRGNGIQPVKELYNFIVDLAEDVYRISRITRLTTDSNFMEKDASGTKRRGKGSMKAF